MGLTLASYAREPRVALEQLADEVQPGWREGGDARTFLPSHGRGLGNRHRRRPAASPGAPRSIAATGLYLAGDWVGNEGWLVDAALASGAAAVGCRPQLRRCPLAA